MLKLIAEWRRDAQRLPQATDEATRARQSERALATGPGPAWRRCHTRWRVATSGSANSCHRVLLVLGRRRHRLRRARVVAVKHQASSRWVSRYLSFAAIVSGGMPAKPIVHR